MENNIGERLSEKEYREIKDIVYNTIGVDLTKNKKPLIVSRLSRRIRYLGLHSFTDYIYYLKGNEQEMEQLYNSITTNVTHFFREERQFDFLVNEYLPAEHQRLKEKKKIRVWSAACSTGEEPYTLAILLKEFFANNDIKIQILASDINTDVLRFAEKGIYTQEKVKKISYNLLKKYFRLGTGENQGLFNVKDNLKSMIQFKQINLMDNNYPLKSPVDIIFCRNVFIYFNEETRDRILNKFYKYMNEKGLLFLGHSEKIHQNYDNHWQIIKSNIYKKI
ncbi:MAG: CheR family methyltransferase [Bacillota bacterium]